jgi:uroporphyrinogen decarboxylase
MIMEAGADATSFGDSFCGPDLISRNMYIEFSNPFHSRLKNDLRNKGIRCICHICGNLDNIIEDVANVGFTGVEVDYKTNIARAQRLLKGKSVMFGPIDPAGVFLFGSPDDVTRNTKEVLALFKDGGLVAGAGCALPPNTPEANIRAFVDTVKRTI